MPVFVTQDRRLVIRYTEGNSFSFNHIENTAADQGVYDLSHAINAIQHPSATPTRRTVVLTRMLVI